ncbi:hypothetical protein C0J45_6076 [Silurus meridionalis]|nr:hypothetical protein C0J45_6076 [Silurus meridionalis]
MGFPTCTPACSCSYQSVNHVTAYDHANRAQKRKQNETGQMNTEKQIFTANASFSPPSLSLYLNEQQLWVEVIFPCAPNVVCQDEDYEEEEGDEKDTPTCCTITDILPQNTTVTLYNKHNMNENQTHTMMVEGSPWKLPFLGLSPGQEYCAVAHYASSPLSDPQCIHVPLLGKQCSVQFINMSVQSLDQEGSIVDEPRQPAIEEEESIAYVSIISLNNTLETSFLRTSSVPQSVYPHLQSLEARYYTTTILQNRIYNENVDTDYLFRGLETDGVSDPAPSVYYQWPRWSSLPALKTGMSSTVICFIFITVAKCVQLEVWGLKRRARLLTFANTVRKTNTALINEAD